MAAVCANQEKNTALYIYLIREAGKSGYHSLKLMLQMMGAFAEFERNLIKERQREGIAQAQKKGVKIGRGRVLQGPQIEDIKRRVALGAIKAELAKEYEISRPTLYAALAVE